MTAVDNSVEAWDARAVRASTDWDAAMWSEHGQTTRFTSVVRALNLRPSDNLLDYGCGTGRLVEFVPPDVSYVGVDRSAGMIEKAKERTKGAFYTKAPPWKFDHVVAIGVFNLSDGWSKEDTWSVLDQLWNDCTRRTLAVCLYRGVAKGSLIYSAPEIAEFAMLRTTNFTVDCSYLPNDAMLVMRRSGVV